MSGTSERTTEVDGVGTAGVDVRGVRASLGEVMRARRDELGLTQAEVAARAGCTKGYISLLESGQRGGEAGGGSGGGAGAGWGSGGASAEMLARLAAALGLEVGVLEAAAAWGRRPASERRVQAAEEAKRAAAAARLRETLRRSAGGAGVDELFKSGELRALIEAAVGGESEQGAPKSSSGQGEIGGTGGGMRVCALPVEVPLINSVAAGYPREFTDLGYPARVADQYVRCPEIRDADAFAARVVGESMEPEYREGDIVVFSPGRAVKGGMDCFVRLERDGETTFKRVYFEEGSGEDGMMGSGGGARIRLQPLNPKFAARVVEREEVAGLYAAVTVMRMIG